MRTDPSCAGVERDDAGRNGGTRPNRHVWMDHPTEIVEEVRIVNSLGLHARPAARLVQTVLPFKSDVYISINAHRVNAKSIMGLLTLAAAQGSRLTISCNGPDAQSAMEALRGLIESGFGEE